MSQNGRQEPDAWESNKAKKVINNKFALISNKHALHKYGHCIAVQDQFQP
jgi:hypothetical protein